MSQLAEKFNEVIFYKTWTSITPDGGINPGTLFHHAKEYGWEDQTISNQNIQDPFLPIGGDFSFLESLIAFKIPLTPPPPRKYVWGDTIVEGKVYSFAGFGGVSKSQAALQLAMSVALGKNFGGLGCVKGASLLLMSEDDLEEIKRRAGAVACHQQLSSNELNEIERLMFVKGLVGEDTRLSKTVDRRMDDTGLTEAIIDLAKRHSEATQQKVKLIVLDHAGTFHGGDFNSKEDVSFTMRLINRIAFETTAAVLLLAHSPKSSSGKEISDATDIAGSTAFVDHARGAIVMATMRVNEAKEYGVSDDDRHKYVSMTVVKNNYGETGKTIWFERESPPNWQCGVLVDGALHKPIKSIAKGVGVQQRVKEFILNHPGQFSKTAIRDKYSGKQGQLKASKNEVDVAIDEMLSAGEIIARPPTDTERKQFAIPKQTSSVLEVSKDAVAD